MDKQQKILQGKQSMANAITWDNSQPKPYNTPEREKEVYGELLQQQFIRDLLADYASYEECAYYNDFFLPENLRFFYYDDTGRCAVFLGSLEDNCAIRNEQGKWKRASISECDEFRDCYLAKVVNSEIKLIQ